MRTMLVVGGGYAGFYTAWKLEKKLTPAEAAGAAAADVMAGDAARL